MDYKDYYKVMGLSRDADEKMIKTTYRRLARKYHPDISKEPRAEEKFKELGEAYEVLKDPKKRKIYDQYGKDWERQQNAQSTSRQSAWGDGASQQHYSHDFFESLFGMPPHFRQQQQAGADYQGEVRINLDDAYKGTIKEIHLPQAQGGTQTLKVKIPAGVTSGQKIRLAGKGGPGRSGSPAGDLYLTIHVDKHPVFDVKGNDIYVTLPVTPWEVALGATIKVPTLGGPVDLKIPAGSQGGHTLRLKKRGLQGMAPGDQYVLLKIVIPPPTTDSSRAFYQKMAEEMPFNPRVKMGV